MKKIIISISTLSTVLAHTQVTAPSTDQNYIFSKTYLSDSSLPNPNVQEVVQYFDGLGRAKQSIAIKATPTGKDLVTHITYDQFGRQTDSWLPAPMNTNNGNIQTGVDAAAISYYGDSFSYSRKNLENSPLDRLLSEVNSGSDWQGHPATLQYSTNIANEVFQFFTTTSWVNKASLSTIKTAPDSENSLGGYYKANSLTKIKVIDEDGNETIEFKNAQGQLILSRKIISASENADTYYIYNEYDQLAFVLSPKAINAFNISVPEANKTVSDTILNSLCYQYRYDGKNRLVEKKLPGKEWEFMVYDKQDRQVLVQDNTLRNTANTFNKKGWMFTKYDQFGRVAYTGFFANTASRQSMQDAINSMSANAGNNEGRSTNFFTLQGMNIYYDKKAFPTGSMTILTVNYYDTYPIYDFNPSFPTTILGQPVLESNIGSSNSLQVMNMVKNIQDDKWTKNYTYYDSKGKTIGTYSINHLGGYTSSESELDFTGTLKKSIIRHKKNTLDTEKIIIENFEYDNKNRLIAHKHQVDNNPIEILSQNTYNDLSLITNKKLGGSSSSSYLQSIDYSYNIHSQLTMINNVDDISGKLFAYKIKYQNPSNPSEAPPSFNGNVSEVDWITQTDGVKRRYGYTYDHLDRLTKAVYQKPGFTVPVINSYNEYVTYDVNGNITHLKRFGGGDDNSYAKIDDIDYTYDGNQLIDSWDSSNNYLGLDGGGIMEYDTNGNMISDEAHFIHNISYNFLNLPINIEKESENFSYTYAANGDKLTAEHLWHEPTTGFDSQEYFGNFHYKNGMLQFIPTQEGYYDFNNNSYIYQYRDQAQNIRLSFTRQNTVAVPIEENNYYPFGLKHTGYNDLQGNPNYSYGYQNQELQAIGFYSFKWRNYMPDLGRFFNVDPLAERFAHNSPYAIQENKMGMGIELEGLELLPHNKGYFAIYGNQMTVKYAPSTQQNAFGQPGFTAGDIGLSTRGYNPNSARMSDGSSGLKLNSYKYSGPVVNSNAQMSDALNYPSSNSDRQRPTTTKTGAEMWNLKQMSVDRAVAADKGVREIVALIKLGANIPAAFKSNEQYVQASRDIASIDQQAVQMDVAINLVNSSGLKMSTENKNNVINYVFDGTLPPGGMMQTSGIVTAGQSILKANNKPIRPTAEQIKQLFTPRQLEINNLVNQTTNP